MKKNIVLGCKYNWCKPCWEKPIQEGEVEYIEKISFSGIPQLLYRILFSIKMKKYFGNKIDVIKKILYKSMCNKLGINKSDSIILVVYDQNEMSHEYSFFKYIKNSYPNVKTCYLFTNIVKLSRANSFNGVEMLNDSFVNVFAFDYNDALKYNFKYNYLIYDREDISTHKKIETDLFFIGQAKNRLDNILKIYNKAKRLNLTMNFNCINISAEDFNLIDREEIRTNPLSYTEVIEGIQKTKCVLDIMQRDSIGCSLNICEAIFYGKKIITDNVHIINEPFFSENRIFVIGYSKGSLEKFINEPIIPYTEAERDLFRAKHLFESV